MEKRTIVLLAVLACPSLAAQHPPRGEPIPQTLTLGQAVNLALARNPNVAAARNTVEMADGDAVTARLHPNPALTLDTENYPYFSSNAGPFFSNQQITARFDYEIQTKKRLKRRTEAAQGAVRREEASFDNVVRLLRLDVQAAYYRALLAQSYLQLAESILEQTDEVISLNRTRFEQGEISERELTRIEVERLRFADDVFQVRLELRNAKAELLALLYAEDLGAYVQLAGDLLTIPELDIRPNAAPSEMYRIASSERPDLRAALTEMERASVQNRLRKPSRRPTSQSAPDTSAAVPTTAWSWGSRSRFRSSTAIRAKSLRLRPRFGERRIWPLQSATALSLRSGKPTTHCR